MADIDRIEDEDALVNMLSKTDDFEQRKKIRARMKVLREKREAERELKKKEQGGQKEDAIAMRQRQAAEKKQRELAALDAHAKEKRERTDIGGREEGLRERHARADAEKHKKLESMKEMAKEQAKAFGEGSEQIRIAKVKEKDAASSLRATKTEKGADGSVTTTSISTTTHKTKDGSTVVTEQQKQITKVGGIGGTAYSIKKAEAAATANRIASSFSNKSFPGTSGVISVKTESWNSRDGITKRSEKTRGFGATGAGARDAFQAMDAANAGASLAPGGRGGVAVQRSPSAIKEMLLEWCRQMTRGYEHVDIKNFSTSWNDGMAFCALIHHFYPTAFDYGRLKPKARRGNFTLAFKVAEQLGGVAPLLDVEDMVRMKNPDWKCVFTYVQQYYRAFRNHDANAANNPQ